MNIGIALKYYRKLNNQTQNKIAEMADVNEKYYGKIERNESSPTVDILEKICLALGVGMPQVVGYQVVEKKEAKVKKECQRNRIKNTEYYCNCCGTSFSSREEDIICPCCGCEFSDDNEYIETYS